MPDMHSCVRALPATSSIMFTSAPCSTSTSCRLPRSLGCWRDNGQALSDADIIQAMQGHWSMKQQGAKVHLCRWGDWTSKASEFDG
eukprot:12082953-Prorocentrum_lima.AAC.1